MEDESLQRQYEEKRGSAGQLQYQNRTQLKPAGKIVLTVGSTLYRLAAEQGHSGAQYKLGMMYENGQGVPQDYEEAVRLYRLAAEKENPVAQCKLGMMYENGKGVSMSKVKAYALYSIAANNFYSKDHPANFNLARIATEMSDQEIDVAKALALEITESHNLEL